MRVIFALFAVMVALGGQAGGSAGQAQSAATPELCRPQSPSDIIEIRVIRPAATFRIQPGPDDIVQRGEGFRVIRGSPIWERFARRICDRSKLATPPKKDDFMPRIVVFVPGSSTANAVVLEFPSEDGRSDVVDFSFDGFTGAIDAKEVRRLLDFAAKVD
ncbi:MULTISPECIES: hypothetical protein [unclassified Sphingomonas]|jgi:hypothetical protein|uniref:hypothetical protein n=1 Tax=unclassified Sphingomonas TaxID=196159 RepID=UPI000B1FEF5A|nr:MULTISPECIES: hypothetical protein [unclassified Sphingomonas]